MIFPAACCALLALIVLAPGCGEARSARPARPLWNKKIFEGFNPPAPAWRSIDREKLAEKLGWWDVTRGNPSSGKLIALTFDAGADGEYTGSILDALKARGLHCTFFLTGQFASAYPATVKRIALEGHELGNHSWSHPKFDGITPAEAASQLSRTETKVKSLTGLSTKPYFRFPYGWKSDALIRQVNGMGYLSVSWTFDTLDSLAGTSPETIRARVNEYASPGAIVLMHCGSKQESEILPSVLDDLGASGYRVVTLSEVLNR